MKKIKVAQIGVLHEHAPGKMYTLRKLPEVFDLVGVVDDRPFSTTPNFGADLERPYEGVKRLTLDEVLSDPELEAVTVEVPNNELVPMAMRCAERGLAIHMDKPAGEDLELYRKLLDLCKAKHLPFQMGFMFRGNPAFQFVRRAIRNRWIGDVCEMELDMNHCYGGEAYQEYLACFSGGIMFNLGCHLVDFVVSAIGRPSKVTPFLQNASGDAAKVRNNCLAVLEYPNTAVTLRACSRCGGTNTFDRRLRVVGTKGSIFFSPVERFDGKSVEIELALAEDAAGFPAGRHTLRTPPQNDRYADQLLEWARVIRGEIESPYPYEHDYLVHEVTLAAAGYNQWR